MQKRRSNLSLPDDVTSHPIRVPLTSREVEALNDALEFEGMLKSRLLRKLVLDWLAEYYGSEGTQYARALAATPGGDHER